MGRVVRKCSVLVGQGQLNRSGAAGDLLYPASQCIRKFQNSICKNVLRTFGAMHYRYTPSVSLYKMF
jgi:hypothetical protein